jgi:hypothetical protein
MLDTLMGRIAGRFRRAESRRRARSLVVGLLSGLPRKNCWTIAEHAGHATTKRRTELSQRVGHVGVFGVRPCRRPDRRGVKL